MDSKKTKVIFRTFKDGEVIAIFPEDNGTNEHWTCLCYLHLGQHGSCNPCALIKDTRLSTPEEYNDLKNELEKIVGYNLEVIKRNHNKFFHIRLEKLENQYA